MYTLLVDGTKSNTAVQVSVLRGRHQRGVCDEHGCDRLPSSYAKPQYQPRLRYSRRYLLYGSLCCELTIQTNDLVVHRTNNVSYLAAYPASVGMKDAGSHLWREASTVNHITKAPKGFLLFHQSEETSPACIQSNRRAMPLCTPAVS